MSEANRALLRYLLLLALVLPTFAGCATLSYYGQVIGGHYSILGRADPIDDLLTRSSVDPALKHKLERVVVIRDFASHELGLPDNKSYRSYANLERSFAVWNVVAAPELSLEPKQSCFAIVGCVAYRGFFERKRAEQEAERLRAEGYDVLVGGVIAYSTLGWFEDPLLNTMLNRPEPELAGLIFHELAHQRVYVRDDTAFNESFATVVEREGVRRWLSVRDADIEYAGFLERARRHERFVALILRYRERLDSLYRSNVDDGIKRAGKSELVDALRREYVALTREWGGYNSYDKWIEGVNNASFISIGLYNEHVEAFQVLLRRHAGDLPAFYRAVEKLARETKDERARTLRELSGEASAERRMNARP